jgi:branched-chain amino acid transport system substrate-binding protein
MLALLPLAQQRRVPLLTISGTARLSEMGNQYFFRFFPSDGTVKVAHARYVVEKLGAKRPAVIYQSTAYGQSGREQLAKTFADLKAPPVLEESVAPTANDLSPALLRAKAANADVLVLHLHAPSTVLAVRQARQLVPNLPIVAGSAMHQPATAALLDPAELKGVCAETAASPVSAATPQMREFLAAYRSAFNGDPDAFAAAQYDAVMMLAHVVRNGARTPEEVRTRLASDQYRGIVTTYKSDGKGNMAHEAKIVCYDGTSRVPKVVERYALRP